MGYTITFLRIIIKIVFYVWVDQLIPGFISPECYSGENDILMLEVTVEKKLRFTSLRSVFYGCIYKK